MSEYPWNEKNNTYTWLSSLYSPFKFPAQKNCHTSNVMFIFLSRNQKNKKRASIKKTITKGNNILNVLNIFLNVF